MSKKKIALSIISALAISSCSALAAPSNDLFYDVPADHWAYSAVTQLAKDGILTGYGDNSFGGDKTITRYEMAQIVANARTHITKANTSDQDLINKLSDEFRDDLDALGVRVARLEKKQSNVKLSGSFAQKYSKAYHAGYIDSKTGNGDSEHRTHWKKELKLNLDASLAKTPIEFHSTFTTEMNSYDGDGFNQERTSPDTAYNNGDLRPNTMRLDTYYVGGPIDKTGLDGQFGVFYQGVQDDFINHAALRGGAISHQDKKNYFNVFTGRLDVKDDDTSIYATKGAAQYTGAQPDWSNKYPVDLATGKVLWDKPNDYSAMQKDSDGRTVFAIKYTGATAPSAGGSLSSDFVRNDTSKTANSNIKYADDNNGPYFVEHQNWGGATKADEEEAYDYSKTGSVTEHKTLNRRRTLSGAVFGHHFTDKLEAAVGYYRYKSAAYDEQALNIMSLTAKQKVGNKGTIYAAYSHGNQGGYNKAWTAEYQFNGAPEMSAADNHRFGYYLGYRYLAPDALVKTVYEDGAQVGQRGWEGGIYYNFCHNLQGQVKYFKGTSITNPGKDRNKLFSSVSFYF